MLARRKKEMQKISKERALEIAEGCECDSAPDARCPVSCCKNCGLYDACNGVCDALLTPVYVGHRKTAFNTASGVVVTKDGEILSPLPSLEVINHSPDGFNWGYSGSGPAQLSLALLLDVLGDPELAQRHHQNFKEEVVASFGDIWQITGDEIRQWLHKEGANIGAD